MTRLIKSEDDMLKQLMDKLNNVKRALDDILSDIIVT
jgi:hypothetical protein